MHEAQGMVKHAWHGRMRRSPTRAGQKPKVKLNQHTYLRHDAVICCHHQHHHVCDRGAAGAHGSERLHRSGRSMRAVSGKPDRRRLDPSQRAPGASTCRCSALLRSSSPNPRQNCRANGMRTAWPGVSRNVRDCWEPGICTSNAPMCCVMPPASCIGGSAAAEVGAWLRRIEACCVAPAHGCHTAPAPAAMVGTGHATPAHPVSPCRRGGGAPLLPRSSCAAHQAAWFCRGPHGCSEGEHEQ